MTPSVRAAGMPGVVTASRLRSALWPAPALSLAALGSVLGCWQLLVAGGAVSADLLPLPGTVWTTLWDVLAEGYRNTALIDNIAATLMRCGVGFVLASVMGVPLGLAIGSSVWVSAAVNPSIQFFRNLPPLAYMILLILWLGPGDQSKIAMLFLVGFPIVVASAASGVRGISRSRVDVARSLGARERDVFMRVILPSALPSLMTGMRLALGVSFSAVVAAELLISTNGLGWMIFSGSRFLRSDIILLGMLILGSIGLALNLVLVAVDGRLIHWRGRDE